MAACTYCNQSISFFESIGPSSVKRCKACNAKLVPVINYWMGALEKAYASSEITDAFERDLAQDLTRWQMPKDMATPLVARVRHLRELTDRAKCVPVINHWASAIETAFTSGGVSDTFERELHQDFTRWHMPQDMAAPLIARLQYLRNLSEIQWGNIPIIQTDIHLDSDEYAHFTLPVTYQKPNKEIKYVPGRLIGTNKNMYFVSNTGKDNAKLDWNNVIQVTIQPYSTSIHTRRLIHLQVARGSGGGVYSVADDPQYAKVIIDTLVRLWKRQLVLYKEQSAHGPIPEHVKTAVFQRDGGRCVQCHYSGPYIEYDHRQPRSKGGQNTVENIQLLCRGCNLKKGNRV